jgi:la-related protein 1
MKVLKNFEGEDLWTVVDRKRRSKPSQPKITEKPSEKWVPKEEKEELDFQFDEELESAISLSGGRLNQFSELSEDESEWEVSDIDINKILIVTQKSRPIKHEGKFIKIL